jgi:AraC-like DNA-binding protein
MVLAGATLLQSLVFATFLLTERFRQALANRFLLAVLLLMAAIKADELFQLAGGLEAYTGWAFVLAPLQPLMTPALYFFIRARSDGEFRLRRVHAWNLVPFLLYAFFWWWTWFRFTIAGREQLLAQRALNGPVHSLLVPVAFDVVQLAYLGAALLVVARHGLAIRQWFSRIDDKSLGWLRPVLILWAAIVLVHIVRTVATGAFGDLQFNIAAIIVLDAGHFILINVLLLAAIADFIARPEPVTFGKYAGSSLAPEERSALFRRAEALMAADQLHRDPDLTLQDLADALAATPRELSEAINGAGGETYYAFVNRRRVETAKEMLAATPSARILDVALASGFGSKSSFNDIFLRLTGSTPSSWRNCTTAGADKS